MTTLSLSRPGLPPDGLQQYVVWLDWDECRAWLTGELSAVERALGLVALAPPWEPGHHWALVGPTGEGKTNLAVQLLDMRKWVMALDPKGQDETLELSGYLRVLDVPPRVRKFGPLQVTSQIWPRDIQRRLDDELPVKLIVGGPSSTDAEDEALRALMAKAVAHARAAGGWTLYVDEFEVVSSQRQFRLGPQVEKMLITARRAGTTVMTSYQAQAWVSKHATRQATFIVVFPTRDEDMIQSVARATGRNWKMLMQIVYALPPFHVAIVPKGHRYPVIITTAPDLAA